MNFEETNELFLRRIPTSPRVSTLGFDCAVEEFVLVQPPASYEQVLGFFPRDASPRIVWTSDGVGVCGSCLSLGQYILPIPMYQIMRTGAFHSLTLFLETTVSREEIENGLAFIAALPQNSDAVDALGSVSISAYNTNECFFSDRGLEQLVLQDEPVCFGNMRFTSEQSRVLALSGAKMIKFDGACRLDGFGAAYGEANVDRWGCTKIVFIGEDFLNYPREMTDLVASGRPFSVQFEDFDVRPPPLVLPSEEPSQEEEDRLLLSLLGNATNLEELGFLDFMDSLYPPNHLVEAVLNHRGPKGLKLEYRGTFHFDLFPLTSARSWNRLCNGIGNGNEYMKCLSFQLHVREPMTEFLDPLCRALRTNRGLVDLVFEGTGIGHFSLFLILQAIQYHPSLLKMKVTMTEDRRQGFDRAHNTHVSHHVREFLAINHHIEQVELPQELIDQEVWDAIVTPCLECNIFRKRLSAVFPPNGSRRRRAALLEAVLQRLRDNHPSAMWLFLQSNQDIVAERLTLLREF